MGAPFTSTVAPSPARRETAWRGALVGLTPLALLVAVSAVALGVTVVIRALIVGQGFLVEQQVVVPVLISGEAVAAIVYAFACVRALRRVGQWRRSGAMAPATAALWALAVSALIVLLPVLLALIIPQNPAPVL